MGSLHESAHETRRRLSELVQLAERFVRASAELDAIRNEMRKLLLNGADPNPPRPTRAARPGAKTRPQQHPKTAKSVEAAKAEAKIVELLKSTPGMRTAAIAKATKSGTTTAAGRLKRLRARSLVERDAGEGRRVSAGGSRPSGAKASGGGSRLNEPRANPAG